MDKVARESLKKDVCVPEFQKFFACFQKAVRCFLANFVAS